MLSLAGPSSQRVDAAVSPRPPVPGDAKRPMSAGRGEAARRNPARRDLVVLGAFVSARAALSFRFRWRRWEGDLVRADRCRAGQGELADEGQATVGPPPRRTRSGHP